MKTALLVCLFVATLSSAANAQRDVSGTSQNTAPSLGTSADKLIASRGGTDDYTLNTRDDRKTFVVTKAERGTSVAIPMRVIREFCGDRDGCSIRMGMHDWNDTGRVASRQHLLFYNRVNRAWRSSWNDAEGRDADGITHSAIHVWACVLTDGKYKNWQNLNDADVGFALLSWTSHVADCYMTIID